MSVGSIGGCGARSDGVSDLSQAVGETGATDEPVVTDGTHWVTTAPSPSAGGVTDEGWQPSGAPSGVNSTPVGATDAEAWWPSTAGSSDDDTSPWYGDTSPASSSDTAPWYGETTTGDSAPFDDTPRAIIAGVASASEARFAACTEVGEPVAVSTDEELEERLLRRWVYCAGWAPVPHDGIEFNADGTWAFLRYDADGELQAQRGFDGGGTWALEWVEPTGAMAKLTMTGSGSSPFLEFQVGPLGMRANSTGGATAYVAADEVLGEDPRSLPEADAGAEITIEGCGEQGDVVSVNSSTELEERLVGSWQFCAGQTPGGVRHDGIEFLADGTWAFLDLDAAGELQQVQSGAGVSGTWVVGSEQTLQVNLDWGGVGEYLHFTFQDDPNAMRMAFTVGFGDYVKVE